MDDHSFEEWLLGRRLGDSTVSKYRGTLIRAQRICVQQGWDLSAMSARDLRDLAGRWPQSRSSLAMLRSTLQHYWRMCETTGPIDAILLPSDANNDIYKGLDDDDADRLEKVAVDHPLGLPTMFGLYLALRRGETARLRWDDFDRGWVQVFGKGRKRRMLPVHSNLAPLLDGGSGWVFPSRNTHLKPNAVSAWIRQVADDAGIGHIKSHALRHTCLTRIYEQTGDVRVVQKFAGHASSQTTERYTRVSQQRLQAAVATLDYRSAAAA